MYTISICSLINELISGYNIVERYPDKKIDNIESISLTRPLIYPKNIEIIVTMRIIRSICVRLFIKLNSFSDYLLL